MNRTLFGVALVIGLFTTSTLRAQWINYQFNADNESLTSNVPLNEISTRAFRNFIKSYGYVPSAIWYKTADGFSVRFYSRDSAMYLIHYTSRGNPIDAHMYYTMKNAPTDVCSAIRSVYPSYDIVFVDELNNGITTVFEVGLLLDDEFLIVDEKRGEISPVQGFTAYRKKP